MVAYQRRRPASGESLTDAAVAIEKKIEKALLVLWDDLPGWQQDNQYIHGGYRPASASYWTSFRSLGYVHNESFNIYSHLLGAVLFTAISVMLYSTLESRYPAASKADVVAFGCFFVGAAVCLGMSATYHTIANHSPEVSSLGNKLDYVGIVFLTVGSFIGTIYYGFYCHPHLQRLYWTMVSGYCPCAIATDARGRRQIGSIGFACAALSIMPRFRTSAWRSYRAGMFVAMGLSGVFPIVQGLVLFGVESMSRQVGLSWVLLQGFLYILGATLYAVGHDGLCEAEGTADHSAESHS